MSVGKTNRLIRIYLPGLVSVIALPLLCTWYFLIHNSLDKQHVFPLVLLDSSFGTRESKGFRPANTIKFLVIDLDGNQQKDKIKMDSAQLKIRQLVLSHDTLIGIRFHFGENSRYWEFVDALDICKIENAQWYFWDQGDLRVFIPVRTPFQNEKNVPPIDQIPLPNNFPLSICD